jgi:Ni/Fe-hydrogenase subunit HybB-like protein
VTSTERRLRRPGAWTGLLFLFLAAGAVVTVLRYTRGLGAVTNLSDRFPWGLWIGFDVLCGVGLAAGCFTLTTAVYVFNIRRFQPIVRSATLTGLLGYSLVVAGLLYDLGRPWNIWHPLVMWNPHSVMFEVSWCVTLYLTVLALEFSGVVFERLRWARAVAVQRAATPLLVMAGAILSTLHQSSLGAMYLIVPEKLHPLWYTPMLPVMFFLSAVVVGLAVIIVESTLSARAFGRGLEMPLHMSIGRTLAVALALFGAFRLFDLARRGALAAALGPGREARLFQLEFVLGVILPLGLLVWPAVRRNSGRLYGAALMVVVGFVVSRLNVAITGFEGAQGGHYVPALPEVIVTLMLTFAAFALAARYLPVFPPFAEPAALEAAVPSRVRRPLATEVVQT